MTTKTERPSRLRREIDALACEMLESGTLKEADYRKITLRDIEPDEAKGPEGLSGEDIRALREQAQMSQAVLARRLRLTPGYVSQLERGAKRATGPTLVLLDLIRRKGVEAIL